MYLYKGLIIGGFATGHIRLFSASTGALLVEACAHARWINALDLCVDTGMVRIFCFFKLRLTGNV